MKILIADDDASMREVCERTLRADGYEVAIVASGDEATRLLDRGWDIILSDIEMPGGVGGLELLRRAKAAGSADILMMTAHAELDLAIEALKLGAFDFILKPFRPDVLQAAVSRCADRRRMSAELAREKDLRAELQQAHSDLARMQGVKDIFGQFVTPEVVDHILSVPQAFWRKGAQRTATVLFADVRSFTPFSSCHPPETVVETLNEVLSLIVGPVQSRGGIVNKFTGDGLLALFGAPLELGDHAAAAARAALDARDTVEDLARSRSARGLPPLRIGIGLNTGDMVAGCVGTQNRAEYSVIGNAVNLAARLEAAAEPGQILLGAATESALEADFQRKKVGPLILRGMPKPVFAWELTGRSA